ncbi:hypothetical protein [Desulfovibrio sp. QI0434]
MPIKQMSLTEIRGCLQSWKVNEALHTGDCFLRKDNPSYYCRVADDYYWGGIKSRFMKNSDVVLCTNRFDFSLLSCLSASHSNKLHIAKSVPQHLNAKIKEAISTNFISTTEISEDVNIILYADSSICLKEILDWNFSHVRRIKFFILTHNIFLVEKLKASALEVLCTFSTSTPVYEIYIDKCDLTHLFIMVQECLELGCSTNNAALALTTFQQLAHYHELDTRSLEDFFVSEPSIGDFADEILSSSSFSLIHKITTSFLKSTDKNQPAEKLLWQINRYLRGCY